MPEKARWGGREADGVSLHEQLVTGTGGWLLARVKLGRKMTPVMKVAWNMMVMNIIKLGCVAW